MVMGCGRGSSSHIEGEFLRLSRQLTWSTSSIIITIHTLRCSLQVRMDGLISDLHKHMYIAVQLQFNDNPVKPFMRV